MCVNDVLQWSAEVPLACVPAGEVPGDGAMGHRLMCTPGLVPWLGSWWPPGRVTPGAQLRRQGPHLYDVSPGVQPRPSLTPPTHRGD